MSEFPWLRLIKNGALLPLLFVDLFPSPSAPLHCPFIYSKSPLSTSLLHFPAIILSQLFAHSLPSLHQLFLLSTSLTSLTETNSDIHHLLPPFSLTIADCCRCLYRVLHFAVKCSWKGAFYNLSTPEYILSLSLPFSLWPVIPRWRFHKHTFINSTPPMPSCATEEGGDGGGELMGECWQNPAGNRGRSDKVLWLSDR